MKERLDKDSCLSLTEFVRISDFKSTERVCKVMASNILMADRTRTLRMLPRLLMLL